jgi:mono/diheme cytochrome c family protein
MPKTLRYLIPLLFLLLTACDSSLAEDIVPPEGAQQQPVMQSTTVTISGPFYPMVPPDPAQGALAYAEKCTPCHGEQGLGDGPLSSRSAVPVAAIGTSEIARAGLPSEWYQLIAEGDLERGMPPFNSLTDRQKWDVIAYVYQLSATDESLALGESLYAENCARCHGDTGQADGSDAAGLSTDPIDFTDQERMAELSAEMMAQTISNGIDDLMPAFDSLSQDELWALTDYLRALSFAGDAGELAQAAVASPTSPTTAEETTQETPQPAAGATAAAPTTFLGNVSVELVNASGGDLPTSVPVTLYAFDNMEITFSETLTTSLDGTYLFQDIEMQPGRAFIAGADYDGGTYGSDVFVAEEGMDELAFQVMLYDSSTDTSQLTMDRAHIFLDFTQQDLVQVVEVFIVSNPTNNAIVAAEPGGPVASFNLPQGAVDLQFQDGVLGERYIETNDGFADTVSVQPGSGQYQVVFAYNLPYDGKLNFSQPMTMDTNAVVIMLPDVGVKVKGEGITDDGLRDMQGTSYKVYSTNNLPAGSPLEFSLSGKVKTGGQVVTTNSSSSTIAIGLGVFGLALVGAGVFLYVRNRKQDQADVALDEETEEQLAGQPPHEDPTTLIDAIIALDDQYKAGKIPEEAYMQRRDELKKRLETATSNQE